MKNVFLYSDPHFGHHNAACVFKNKDGSPLRPYSSAEEMDEDMVQRYNDKVKPTDKVYFLGDVVINKKNLPILERLNGDKILIKGNHDIEKAHVYLKYFRDIRAYHVLNGFILSHIPVHTSQLPRFGFNICGHLHSNKVLLDNGEEDLRYKCVCVEQTGFAPVNFNDIISEMNERKKILSVMYPDNKKYQII